MGVSEGMFSMGGGIKAEDSETAAETSLPVPEEETPARMGTCAPCGICLHLWGDAVGVWTHLQILC